MQIRDIFVKDIGRSMNPVIKVSDQDDEDTIFQELDEYVVTQEIDRNFEKLYKGISDGIRGDKDHIGVWISGDFGSGKSHFLKISSFLLKNQKIRDKPAIEYLSSKVSPQVYQMMQAVGRRNIDTILFDIDAKSRTGQNEDSLVQVFMQVFNEMLGLSSEISVARLERYLIFEGHYDSFKESYSKFSNHPWEEDRNKPAFIRNKVAQALVDSNIYPDEGEARKVADDISKSSEISAKDFAREVGIFCRSKGPNYSLFFLVDEVGQFISGNVQKMLKLQTIVQELGVEANGQAWCVVTSQEDIDSIVSGVSNHDFSKIQGRFSTRIKMVSTDVKEVIEKRVLEKKDDAFTTLKAYYEGNSADIRNRLSIKNTMEIRLFRDADEFAATHPFIPYQYDMLQTMLTQLRNKSSAGKNLSNAARSMLRIFKDAAFLYGDHDLESVVPLYQFFEPIKDELDQPTGIVFHRAAENSLLNDFDMDVLKTLFLVKYFDGLATTVDTVAGLMISSFSQNRLELRSAVQESLERLESQNFVQRIGDTYIYLTNQEQEISHEIKNESVDFATVYQRMAEVAFGQILEMNGKYKFDANHIYSANRFIDDENIANTEHELSVRISTPSDRTPEPFLKSKSEFSVLMKLPDDKRIMDAFVEYIRTENFIRKKEGTVLQKSYREVLAARKEEVPEMKRRAASMLDGALKSSRIFVNQEEVSISDSLPSRKRFEDAMDRLIKSAYSKMGYVRTNMSSKDVENIFKIGTLEPFDQASSNSRQAIDDLMSYLSECDKNHTTVTVKNVIDKFERKPYGFAEADIQWILALLFRHGRVDLTFEGTTYQGRNSKLQDAKILLMNSRNYANVRINVKEAVTSAQIHMAKDIFDGLFAVSLQPDEVALVDTINTEASKMIESIDKKLEIYRTVPEYPGKETLEEIRDSMSKISKMGSPELFKYTEKEQDKLRMMRGRYDSIAEFLGDNSAQRKLFDRGIQACRSYEASSNYLDSDAASTYGEIKAILDSKDSKRIPQLNKYCPAMETKIREVTEQLRSDQLQRLELEYAIPAELSQGHPELVSSWQSAVEDAASKLRNSGTIDEINGVISGLGFKTRSILRSIPKPAEPVSDPVPSGSPGVVSSQPTVPAGTSSEPSSVRAVYMGSVPDTVRKIESDEDIERLLDEIRSNLRKNLANGPFEIRW